MTEGFVVIAAAIGFDPIELIRSLAEAN